MQSALGMSYRFIADVASLARDCLRPQQIRRQYRHHCRPSSDGFGKSLARARQQSHPRALQAARTFGKFSIMSEVRKIALFGGTFDPVHLGHRLMAALAQQALGLDEVRFLPCRISPHKTGRVPASAEDRLEMLRRTTADLAWAVVDDWELRRDAASFSYATAEAMQVRFANARLFWILGGDQWNALEDWEQPQRLAACVEFIVLSRGSPPQPRPGFVMHALVGSHPASASAIRDAFAHGASNHPWLAPTVAEWITSRCLYRK